MVTKMEVKERSSNLELFRIVCMLAIVAHHYVVNSGLMWADDSPISQNPTNLKSIYLLLFGMWGKTGINCFLMITGYFMCKSRITLKKFLKLLLEVYFYKIIIYLIFLIVGREQLSLLRVIKIVSPIWNISDNFVGCFLVFFLTIPFLNVLVQNLSKKQHQLLLALTLGIYTLCGSMPGFEVRFNYVVWFGIIYLIASYIRFYPSKWLDNRKLWGGATLLASIAAMASVVFMQLKLNRTPFFFVSDSNRILAVAVAVCSFNWFRLLPIGQSKIINWVASSTFAVLLIHASSDAMRQWLWRDTIDCVGQYAATLPHLILTSCTSVIVIFAICVIIDKVRINLLERPIFEWWDRKAIKRA